jgi:hypothetical protein
LTWHRKKLDLVSRIVRIRCIRINTMVVEVVVSDMGGGRRMCGGELEKLFVFDTMLKWHKARPS